MSRARDRSVLVVAEGGLTSAPVFGPEFLNQRRQKTLNFRIGIAERLDPLDRMADCRVIPAVVEPADPRRASASHGWAKYMATCRLNAAG